MTDIKTTQKKRTRFVSRLLPVEKTCNANLPEITRLAEDLFKSHFHTAGDEGKIEPKKVHSFTC
jgi:tRNA acetyltransferase TAN1